MRGAVVNLGAIVWALAVLFGAYVALLFILGIHWTSIYDDLTASVALVGGLAFLARRTIRRVDPKNDFRRLLRICRNLPLAARVPGAIGLVIVALCCDRYLDGAPADYRLSSFVIPVLVSIVVFDLKPGLFAVGASALAVNFLVIPPLDASASGKPIAGDGYVKAFKATF